MNFPLLRSLKKTKKASFNQSGQGVIQVLIAIGMMAVFATLFASMMSSQHKQVKFLELKQESVDAKNQIFQILSNYTLGCTAVNVARGDLSFPTSPVPRTLNFKKFLQTDGSELMSVENGLANSNLINIESLAFEQLTGSGDSYSARMKIVLKPKDSTQITPQPLLIGGINITTKTSPTDPNVKQIITCTNTAPFIILKDLIFGGAYGDGSPTYTNPMTGSNSCAAGYSTVRVMGWPNSGSGDYSLYICYRDARDTTSLPPATFYAYGGTYGDSPQGHPNPYTGGTSCPAGYTAQKVMGRTGVDWGLWICYKNLGTTPPDDTNSKRFGGFYSHNPYISVGNPVTGSHSCPSGYTADTSYGEYNKDWPLFTCVKP